MLSLTSQWFLRPGCEQTAIAALRQLAADVEAQEPDTLTYLVHTPYAGLQSLPPADPLSVLFFEEYSDDAAFQRHVTGPVFTGFVKQHGDLFVSAHGSAFTFVMFLTRQAGFVRRTATGEVAQTNQHPSVMFEVIAKDQGNLKSFYQKVFGWNYTLGTGGFAYVKFPVETLPLLGGIGQANSTIPGFEPGHNFYLLVDNLEAAVESAVAAGGTRFVDPTEVDGYHFAMVKDPEDNPIGLIQPFTA